MMAYFYTQRRSAAEQAVDRFNALSEDIYFGAFVRENVAMNGTAATAAIMPATWPARACPAAL